MLLQNDEKNFQNDGVVLIYHEKIHFLRTSIDRFFWPCPKQRIILLQNETSRNIQPKSMSGKNVRISAAVETKSWKSEKCCSKNNKNNKKRNKRNKNATCCISSGHKFFSWQLSFWTSFHISNRFRFKEKIRKMLFRNEKKVWISELMKFFRFFSK